jgi:hypothetical protein
VNYYSILRLKKTLRTDGPAIKRDSESRNIPSSYRIDNGSWNIPSNINYRKIVISPRFVYTEIIDLCYPPHTLNVNLNTNDEELVKYEIDIEANVYVGCKPVSKRQSIVLTRLCDGSILDTNGELITIFETVDLIDLRFAAKLNQQGIDFLIREMQELLEFIDLIRMECVGKCMIGIDDLNYIALQKCDTNYRLKIHCTLICQMNYFAEKYGKINCKFIPLYYIFHY